MSPLQRTRVHLLTTAPLALASGERCPLSPMFSQRDHATRGRPRSLTPCPPLTTSIRHGARPRRDPVWSGACGTGFLGSYSTNLPCHHSSFTGHASPQPQLKDHLAGTPSGDRTGPFPLSPGLPPIPPHLMKQVQEGKYVDLGDFLPEGLSYAFDRLREGTEEKASGKRLPIKTPTESTPQWQYTLHPRGHVRWPPTWPSS